MDVIISQIPWISSTLSFVRSQGLFNSGDLLRVDQVPDVLKEPYIFTGYRPMGRPWKYYFCSILFFHNESINVWTHTVGFFVVLLRLIEFLGNFDLLQDQTSWPVLGFGTCCLLSLALSAAAHLLHSRSRWHHFLFFMMDYMGVTFYAFGTGIISMYTCSSISYHDAVHQWYLPINALLCWFSFFACCLAKTHLSHNNIKRKSLMLAAVTLHGLYVSLPVATRYVECLLSPTCSVDSLNHITLVFLTVCLCAASFAGHLPESCLLGWCDFVGHGHQIFHTLAVIVMMLEFRIVHIEINVTGAARNLRPDLTQICLYLVLLFLLEMATLGYYIHFIFFNRLDSEIPRADVQESMNTKDGLETKVQSNNNEEELKNGQKKSD